MEHDWPGNVRELRNTLERAAAMAANDQISGPLIERALPQRQRNNPAATHRGDLSMRLAAAERQALVDALAASGGSRTAAARRLGVSRSQFYEKLKRHAL